MRAFEYLVIEQPDGWWIMREGNGLGPYPSRSVAHERANALAAQPIQKQPMLFTSPIGRDVAPIGAGEGTFSDVA